MSGYGDGHGAGYGYGDGDGYGDGHGDGHGDGYGDGNGYGDGDGNGYGYGHGYGDGDGYGNGNGNGSENSKQYFSIFLEEYRARSNLSDVKIVFWRSHADGTPSNGGSKTKAYVGLTEEVEGPLQLCSRRALHGTLSPHMWEGERLWVVALHQPVGQEANKFGALKRTIIADLGKYPF